MAGWCGWAGLGFAAAWWLVWLRGLRRGREDGRGLPVTPLSPGTVIPVICLVLGPLTLQGRFLLP
jgi:hypothetical protein